MIPGIVASSAQGFSLSSADAWWSPASRSGTTMLDRVGTAHAVATGVTYSTDGTHHFAALRSAASSGFAVADAAPVRPGAGSWTWLMLATPRVSVTGSLIWAAKREGAGLGWNLFTAGGTLTGTYDNDPGTAGVASVVGGAVAFGIRSAVALRLAGSTLTLLVDGAVVGTSVVVPTSIDNALNLAIGRGSGVTTLYSNLDLYGAAWWRRALSDAEVAVAAPALLAASAV